MDFMTADQHSCLFINSWVDENERERFLNVSTIDTIEYKKNQYTDIFSHTSNLSMIFQIVS